MKFFLPLILCTSLLGCRSQSNFVPEIITVVPLSTTMKLGPYTHPMLPKYLGATLEVLIDHPEIAIYDNISYDTNASDEASQFYTTWLTPRKTGDTSVTVSWTMPDGQRELIKYYKIRVIP